MSDDDTNDGVDDDETEDHDDDDEYFIDLFVLNVIITHNQH